MSTSGDPRRSQETLKGLLPLHLPMITSLGLGLGLGLGFNDWRRLNEDSLLGVQNNFQHVARIQDCPIVLRLVER